MSWQGLLRSLLDGKYVLHFQRGESQRSHCLALIWSEHFLGRGLGEHSTVSS